MRQALHALTVTPDSAHPRTGGADARHHNAHHVDAHSYDSDSYDADNFDADESPPDETPPLSEPAYAVPLRVDRTAAPRYRLFNVGHERLVGVTVSLLGSGAMSSLAPQTLDVGAAVEVVIRGDDLARRTVLVVRWFRPSGDEYLWRVSF